MIHSENLYKSIMRNFNKNYDDIYAEKRFAANKDEKCDERYDENCYEIL